MMADHELWWWTACQVAQAIASRKLSAREYLDSLADRVERVNPALGLVVTIDSRAWEWAAAADDATANGRITGPLHGVAMTVKDTLATAGLRTTGGTKDLASYIPGRDAHVVAQLRRSGAIIFGKTNTPAYAGDVQTSNVLFGTSRNPWHPDYTTGGSSGGSAGAVAAGLSPLEMGSDVAGSIRIPAASCGVFGHKPSSRLVSLDGHVPPMPQKTTPPDLAVIGPLARSVDDLELALAVVAGPDPWDSPAWHVRLPPPRPVRRVAVWYDDPHCPVDDEIREALARAAGVLASTGVVVEDAVPPGVSLAASNMVFRRLLVCVASGDYSPQELEEIAAGARRPRPELGAEFYAQRHWEWMAANDARRRLRTCWDNFFSEPGGYDAILLPVMPNLIQPHDTRPMSAREIVVNGVARPYWDQIVWAGLTGVSDLPSTVVPLGTDSRGLPIGMAIAGPYLQDRTTLSLAQIMGRLVSPLDHPIVATATSA